MLASTLTFDDASGDDVSFVLISQDGTGTKRIDLATTLQLPAELNIRHQSSGKSPAIVDRHLVQFTRTVSTTNGPQVVTCNFTLLVPRVAEVTGQIVYDMVHNLIDFLQSGGSASLSATTNIDALLRGES